MSTTLTRLPAPVTGAAVIAATAAVLAVAYFPADPGEGSALAGYLAVMAVLTLIAAFLFGRVAPARAGDAERSARAAVYCAVPAVVTLLVFWTGLPLVLGAAAAALGHEGRSTRPGTLAMIAGALAFLLATAACLSGM